jgi:hypothetical protein
MPPRAAAPQMTLDESWPVVPKGIVSIMWPT